MKRNESNLDRIIRAILGVVLLVVGIWGGLQGALPVVLIVIGAVLLFTAITGFCLIYRIFNYSTKK